MKKKSNIKPVFKPPTSTIKAYKSLQKLISLNERPTQAAQGKLSLKQQIEHIQKQFDQQHSQRDQEYKQLYSLIMDIQQCQNTFLQEKKSQEQKSHKRNSTSSIAMKDDFSEDSHFLKNCSGDSFISKKAASLSRIAPIYDHFFEESNVEQLPHINSPSKMSKKPNESVTVKDKLTRSHVNAPETVVLSNPDIPISKGLISRKQRCGHTAFNSPKQFNSNNESSATLQKKFFQKRKIKFEKTDTLQDEPNKLSAQAYGSVIKEKPISSASYSKLCDTNYSTTSSGLFITENALELRVGFIENKLKGIEETVKKISTKESQNCNTLHKQRAQTSDKLKELSDLIKTISETQKKDTQCLRKRQEELLEKINLKGSQIECSIFETLEKQLQNISKSMKQTFTTQFQNHLSILKKQAQQSQNKIQNFLLKDQKSVSKTQQIEQTLKKLNSQILQDKQQLNSRVNEIEQIMSELMKVSMKLTEKMNKISEITQVCEPVAYIEKESKSKCSKRTVTTNSTQKAFIDSCSIERNSIKQADSSQQQTPTKQFDQQSVQSQSEYSPGQNENDNKDENKDFSVHKISLNEIDSDIENMSEIIIRQPSTIRTALEFQQSESQRNSQQNE